MYVSNNNTGFYLFDGENVVLMLNFLQKRATRGS